jgi:hypothetical protein
LTLDFGFQPEQEIDPEFEVRISMSWEHALTLSRILDRVVAEWEKQVPSLMSMRMKLAEAENQILAKQRAEQESKEES